jgi:hypothetical protein
MFGGIGRVAVNRQRPPAARHFIERDACVCIEHAQQHIDQQHSAVAINHDQIGIVVRKLFIPPHPIISISDHIFPFSFFRIQRLTDALFVGECFNHVEECMANDTFPSGRRRSHGKTCLCYS